MKKILTGLLSLFFINALPVHGYESKVIQTKDLEFWSDTFGDKRNPAMLLIMGSGGQGLFWPQNFCESLANKGYYVIRYDHRDTGLSSSIDYKTNPYTLLDMAEDAISILDHYKIQKAHIVGASMGGAIGMLFAAHHPERTQTLTLIASTTDMSPAFDAFAGKPNNSTLSKPKEVILELTKKLTTPPSTLNEKVEAFILGARANNGTQVPIEEEFLRQTALQNFVRMRNPQGIVNHFQAIQASYTLHTASANMIKAPTLILHGDEDPVFPIDHAYALNKTIAHSKFFVLTGFGHGFTNTQFFNPIIEKIEKFTNIK